MAETKNIMIVGVGGQGTVLASKLIAAAAMEKTSYKPYFRWNYS